MMPDHVRQTMRWALDNYLKYFPSPVWSAMQKVEEWYVELEDNEIPPEVQGAINQLNSFCYYNDQGWRIETAVGTLSRWVAELKGEEPDD